MGVDYNQLKEILERKANKAINHLDELKCFVPEFKTVLDSVLYISETLKDLMFLDTECQDCKKKKENKGDEMFGDALHNKSLDQLAGLIGKTYEPLDLDKIYDPNRVVLFYSDHCQPCKILKPILEKVTNELNIQLEAISVDDENGLSHVEKYNIPAWPTVLVLKDNTIFHTSLGADHKKTSPVLYQDMKELITGVFE